MIDDELDLLKRLRRHWLASRRLGPGRLLGGPSRRLPGGGTEATALRDYSPGDDYRHIDWTICARRDELLTRVFEGRRERPVHLLLDCSASMGLGQPPKLRLARRVAAALGYMAMMGGDRLDAAAFSGRVVEVLPPLVGEARIGAMLRFMGRIELGPGETDLAAAEPLLRGRSPGTLIVISDLYDRRGFQPGLDALRRHGHELRVVQVFDPQDAEPGPLGDVELCDVETGATVPAVVTERIAARYGRLFAEFQQSVRDYCRRYRMPCVQLPTNLPDEEMLAELFHLKAATVGRASTHIE